MENSKLLCDLHYISVGRNFSEFPYLHMLCISQLKGIEALLSTSAFFPCNLPRTVGYKSAEKKMRLEMGVVCAITVGI